MKMESMIRRLLENRKKALREEEDNSPDSQYRDYLEKHRKGVLQTYYDVILPILVIDKVDDETLDEIEELILNHDASKDDPVEFDAYRNYFYDKDNNPRSSEEFSLAWNHHQKCNPHHWQYWCLVNDVDDPQVQPLDIPFKYVIEMLCDWQSAGAHYGNTAYDWYEKQKDKMILSDNTKKIIEKYITNLR